MSTEIASLHATIGADTSEFDRALKNTDDALGRFEGKANGLGSVLQTGLAAAFTVTTVAVGGLAAGIGMAIGAAASMEQQAANISAVFGDMAPPIEDVKSAISNLALDPNLVVTTNEAAAGIQMLAQNGLTWDQIAQGAARSSILLSNATGTDLATSADIATNALGIFGLEVKDLDSVVATFTNAANKSQFGVNDWGYALSNAGPKAAALGIELDELFAAMTMTSSGFTSGMTAGTSWAYLINGLTPSTDKATKAMQDLGLITEDGANKFFNASGEAKSLDEIMLLLQGAFGGLTTEQKMAYSETIFGQEAFGALAGVLGMNVDEYNKLIPAMTDFDAVQEGAATRTDTLAARWENLKGKAEALTIQIGDKFLPVAEKVLGWVSTLVDEYGDDVVTWFGNIATSVGGLVDALLNWRTGAGEDTLVWLNDEMPIATDAAMKSMNAFNDEFKELKNEWGETLDALNVFWGEHGTAVMAVVDFVAAYTVGELSKTLQQVSTVTQFGLNVIQGDWGKAWGNIVEMQEINNTAMQRKQEAAVNLFVRLFADGGESAGDGFGTGLENSTDKAERAVGDFGDAMAHEMENSLEIRSPSRVFERFGEDTVAGFKQGFDERWRTFERGTSTTVGGWISWFKSIFQFGSPSKLFEDYGENVVLGFARGINNTEGVAQDALSGLTPAQMTSNFGTAPTPAVSTSRIEQLLEILIAELRAKNMNVTVQGGGQANGNGYGALVGFKAGLR